MKDFVNVGEENGGNNSVKPTKKTGENSVIGSNLNSNGELEIGTVINNRYKITRLLGKGGMADVYLTVDKANNKEVAVKVLRRELTNDDEFIRRFDTEARAASSLSFPNIIKVYDVGIDGNIRYMVMEYVQGISLKELITKNGHLEWEVALPIAIQIGLALENAHKNGIVHRDIKPHNIIITPDFIAKVTDFGIARAAAANTVTLTGTKAFGSVHYFSPEQARGGIVGEQSDIYSMGILLYEMLTGKVPFNGDTSVSVALKHIQEQPVEPKVLNPDIPDGINNIVMKCIQKSTDYRYKKARDLVDEMDAFTIDPNGLYGFIDKPDEKDVTTRITAMGRAPNFYKLKELEAVHKKRKRIRIREAIIIFVALLLTVGALYKATIFAVDWIKEQFKSPIAEYTIEDYVGSNIEEIKIRLDEVDIAYVILYEQNETVEQGLVFYQSVPKGLKVRPGGSSSITLKVSSGKDTVRLGDYTGKNYKIAESELTQIMGLKVLIIRKLSNDMEKDNVIETLPGAGNDVPSGSEVTLVVSDGLINVKVPDILGMRRIDAISLLQANNLRKGSEALLNDPNLPEDQQYVIGSDPIPGTNVQALTSVNLILGSYDDYLNTILPVATATPIPTAEPTATLTPTP